MNKIMSNEKYVKEGGSRCPVCQSDNIVGGSLDHGGDVVYQVVSCNKCGCEWTDEYQLAGFSELKDKYGEPFINDDYNNLDYKEKHDPTTMD